MTTKTIEDPTEEELTELMATADEDATWTIQEEVPKSDGSELRDHEADSKNEAFRILNGIRGSPEVASEVVCVEVNESDNEDDGEEVEKEESRVNLKIQPGTKDELDECKRDQETWDECLRRLAQLHRATMAGE